MNWGWEQKVKAKREKQREASLKLMQAQKPLSAKDIENVASAYDLPDLGKDDDFEKQPGALLWAKPDIHLGGGGPVNNMSWFTFATALNSPAYFFYTYAFESLAPVEPLPEETIVVSVVGWRAWVTTPMDGRLHSMAWDEEWKPFERLEKRCQSEKSCQGAHCGCGIHAFKRIEDVMEQYDIERLRRAGHLWLVGQVHLWGFIVEHRLGYRAQYAYPKCFKGDGILAKRYARMFGVPCEP